MRRSTPVPRFQPSSEKPQGRHPVPPLSEEHWRTLVEQVKDYAIYMVDPAGRNVSWNEGVARVLGFAEAEFLGDHMSRVFTPEDRAADVPQRELGDAERHGRTSGDRWMMRKDGTRFWASGITTALRDQEGRLL